MKITDVDLEEAAAESEQDRRDHRQLAVYVDWLLQHEDSMRVPIAVRRLVDAGIDPVVVAKTLAIGSRDGGYVYRLTARAASLAEHELVAVDWISIAIRDIEPDLGAMMLVSGSAWIAMQFGVSRFLLGDMITAAPVRARREDRRGYGVVDLVDHHGVGDRASIIAAIHSAELPLFAPLESAAFEVPS